MASNDLESTDKESWGAQVEAELEKSKQQHHQSVLTPSVSPMRARLRSNTTTAD